MAALLREDAATQPIESGRFGNGLEYLIGARQAQHSDAICENVIFLLQASDEARYWPPSFCEPHRSPPVRFAADFAPAR